MPNMGQSIPTFSKGDGAVGLQIAAIHSLLPFFRGEHGESFRRPALNLLTSAWLSLQQKDLLALKEFGVLTEEFNLQIRNIQKRATSPIGVALTQVLLSDGGDNLLKFSEVFPNLCLAGMDFHLPGLDKKVLELFHRIKDCQGINLVGANLRKANLIGANLSLANLSRANLRKANLLRANLLWADLIGADLIGADLSQANLNRANLNQANLSQANLRESNLRAANLRAANLSGANLRDVNLKRAILTDTGNTELNDKIKQQGGVVLYKQSNEFGFKKIEITQGDIQLIYRIFFDIDLAKTQLENPDWQISVVKN